MKITKGHYNYWIEKNTQVSWFKNNNPIDINQLIPKSAKDKKLDQSFVAHNLISLLKRYRSRGEDLVTHLKRISISAGTLIRPERRRAYAKKWLNRILYDRFNRMLCERSKKS